MSRIDVRKLEQRLDAADRRQRVAWDAEDAAKVETEGLAVALEALTSRGLTGPVAEFLAEALRQAEGRERDATREADVAVDAFGEIEEELAQIGE